jgi:Tfp pilus assembly protein PilF
VRFLTALCALILAPALAAQDGIPKRPKLPKDSDTNDARVYVAWGDLGATPWDKAHDAYYWAWRLEPHITAYLHKRYLALYWRQPAGWREEFDRGAKYVLKSKDAKLIDSLWPEILKRNPFPHLLSPCYYPELVDSRDPMVAGLQFHNQGCHRQAAERLETALARRPQHWGLRLRRAQSLFFTREYRAAAAEVQVVLDTLRNKDEKYLDQWYNTKEFLEYMVAMALFRARDIPGAKAALGRALTENLSYYPAHAMLSQIAMDQGDISVALQEADLAVGLREDDGVLRFDYGVLLHRAGKLAEAEAQLKRAIELEPYWADARRILAITLDRLNKREEAVAAYEAFVARAPQRENIQIREAQERVAALRAAGGS